MSTADCQIVIYTLVMYIRGFWAQRQVHSFYCWFYCEDVMVSNETESMSFVYCNRYLFFSLQ